MMRIKTPKCGRIKRELEKRAPKLVEKRKKTLILEGTKTTSVSEFIHLKKEYSIKYPRRKDKLTSLEFSRSSRIAACLWSPNSINFALRLKKPGPSMDMVVLRHRRPDDSLRKEAMKMAPDSTKGKVGSVLLANRSKGVK